MFYGRLAWNTFIVFLYGGEYKSVLGPIVYHQIYPAQVSRQDILMCEEYQRAKKQYTMRYPMLCYGPTERGAIYIILKNIQTLLPFLTDSANPAKTNALMQVWQACPIPPTEPTQSPHRAHSEPTQSPHRAHCKNLGKVHLRAFKEREFEMFNP